MLRKVVFLVRATHQKRLSPCFKDTVSSHLNYLWLLTQLFTPSVKLIWAPLSHFGVGAAGEWGWTYIQKRSLHCCVYCSTGWLTPLRCGINLSIHWWITECGGILMEQHSATKKNGIISFAKHLELENRATLNRWDTERQLPFVLCSLWGLRKNRWDNNMQTTKLHCTEGHESWA